MFKSKSIAFNQGLVLVSTALLIGMMIGMSLNGFSKLNRVARESATLSKEKAHDTQRNLAKVQESLDLTLQKQVTSQTLNSELDSAMNSLASRIETLVADFQEQIEAMKHTERTVRLVGLKTRKFNEKLSEGIETLEYIYEPMEETDERFDLEDLQGEIIDQRDSFQKEVIVALESSASALKSTLEQIMQTTQAVSAVSDQMSVNQSLLAETQTISTTTSELASTSMALLTETSQSQEEATITLNQSATEIEDSAVSNRNRIVLSSVLALAAILGISFINVRSLVKRLNQLIQALTTSGESTETSASNLKTVSHTSSRSSTKLAALIQETSAGMEEINSVARASSERASTSREASEHSVNQANKMESHMVQLAESMTQIDSSSNEIAAIVSTIDEIAFQTNILALNAAVEAAHAGTAGSGFAVVAEEVRSLAERCTNAAQNTSKIVERSQSTSKTALSHCDQVSGLISGICGELRSTKDIAAGIASACKEQNTGVSQINTALSEIEEIAQRLASDSEQAADSCENLDSQVGNLNAQVVNLEAIIHGQRKKK